MGTVLFYLNENLLFKVPVVLDGMRVTYCKHVTNDAAVTTWSAIPNPFVLLVYFWQKEFYVGRCSLLLTN